jgi:acyl dehydratase
MLSAGYDRIRFVKPVYFGDTLTVEYEITEVDRDRRRTFAKIEVTNQKGEMVAVATHIMQMV